MLVRRPHQTALRPVRLVLCAALVTAASPIAKSAQGPPARATTPVKSAADVALEGLVRALESPVYGEREAATKALFESNGRAVSPLLSVAKSGSLEAAVRAVGVLEAIYVAADAKRETTVVDSTENALEQIVREDRASVSDRAEMVLEVHDDIRETRAMAEIERLNGVLLFRDPSEMPLIANRRFNMVPLPLEPQLDRPHKGRGVLKMVIIGPNWQGGDAGLKHVARLKQLKLLYRIEGKQVTDEGINRLRAGLPGLEVQVRGAAKLGIVPLLPLMNPGDVGCAIDEITKGEAADNAGLRRGDVLKRLAGRPIEDFDRLVEMLRNYKPDETVEITYERNDRAATVNVTLTGWDKPLIKAPAKPR